MPTPLAKYQTSHLLLALALLSGSPALADWFAEVRVEQATNDAFPRPTIGVAAGSSPTLSFHLALVYRCPPGTNRRTLLTSIADTVRQDEIAADQPSPVTVRVDVPLRQLPWLAEPGPACAGMRRRPDEIGNAGTRYFRLHAAATGVVTLACRGDNGRESAADAATVLDAWLSCPASERSAAR